MGLKSLWKKLEVKKIISNPKFQAPTKNSPSLPPSPLRGEVKGEGIFDLKAWNFVVPYRSVLCALLYARNTLALISLKNLPAITICFLTS
jgi:hypothetical protein